jgi:polysaccharide export outer membrane protein
VIGPEDQLLIQVQDSPEIGDKQIRVDPNGLIYLPLAGEITAAGRNVEQLRAAIREKLLPFIIQPRVTVNVVDSRSQPVSILGAVTKPGEYQLVEQKTLYQVLSLAGGLATDAGSMVTITRKKEYGPLPLTNSANDPSGDFIVGSVGVKSIMDATDPQENIVIQPYDTISVPRAERVYVIGSVQKSGAFLLNDRPSVTVLQALSMAEGLQRAAASDRAKILHHAPGKSERVEIAVNLKRVLAGKDADIPLSSDDILFVPNSAAKQATLRALEAAIQTGSGILIWK